MAAIALVMSKNNKRFRWVEAKGYISIYEKGQPAQRVQKGTQSYKALAEMFAEYLLKNPARAAQLGEALSYTTAKNHFGFIGGQLRRLDMTTLKDYSLSHTTKHSKEVTRSLLLNVL